MASPNLSSHSRVAAAVGTSPIRGWRAAAVSRWAGLRQPTAARAPAECHVDAKAFAAWRDPLQYRREQLAPDAPLHRLLDAAGQHAQWCQRLQPGQGRGVAVGGAVDGAMNGAAGRGWSVQVARVSKPLSDGGDGSVPLLDRLTLVMACDLSGLTSAMTLALQQQIERRVALLLAPMILPRSAAVIDLHLLPAAGGPTWHVDPEALRAALLNAQASLLRRSPLAGGLAALLHGLNAFAAAAGRR